MFCMYMVRGGVVILFHTLDTGGRGQGQNILGGVDYFFHASVSGIFNKYV